MLLQRMHSAVGSQPTKCTHNLTTAWQSAIDYVMCTLAAFLLVPWFLISSGTKFSLFLRVSVEACRLVLGAWREASRLEASRLLGEGACWCVGLCERVTRGEGKGSVGERGYHLYAKMCVTEG